ncbi:DUF3558 domain-containing protein [Williamsia deligens]|uniref:DUF3558 domain-containing protein n=1 Tax=Williamsia deligens TaxID=321325 RepID=A0ABW3G313_9NOCA|nr:DUF3558 domain-containing protein [Williamsia deligens]MCP2194627.1 Protein of unknown function (DUF3558) [Williamsia deligens]
MTRRAAAALVAVLSVMLLVAGCTRSVDGEARPLGGGTAQGDGSDKGSVDTDQFDKLLLECTLLSPEQIATAVGGTAAESTFNGAICRWVVSGGTPLGVTFTWFESGTMSVEKQTVTRMGYATDNIRVSGTTAFTSRDPQRPGVCGVTAKSPDRGIYTWWVEPRGGQAAGDPCAAPTKLMELVLRGSA